MKLDKKFAEALTNALIDKIKAIEKEHWEQPWFDNVRVSPKNLDGKPYNGLNKVLLSWLGGHREVPVYMTYLRAKQEGLSVLSGERSIPIQYGSKVAFHKDKDKSISIEKYNTLSEEEKENYKVAFMMKHYSVFNIEQTNVKEVNPALYERLKEQVKYEQRTLEDSSRPLDTLVMKQGWYTPILLDQVSQAFYLPQEDAVHLPRKQFFKSDDLYYSTMLHEMAHSTGHRDRLNRDIKGTFGSKKYGKEELVAELSSAIVGQQYGVSKTILDSNANYLHNWLNAISQEPEFLNEVLEEVVSASDMIVDRVEEVQREKIDQEMNAIEVKQDEKTMETNHTQEKDLVGRIDYFFGRSGEIADSVSYYDKERYLKAIKEELYNNPTGFKHHTITQDPSIHKAVNDLLHNEFGERSLTGDEASEKQEITSSTKTSTQENQDSRLMNSTQAIEINQEILPYAQIYAQEELMLPKEVKNRVDLPQNLMIKIDHREEILKELDVTYSPDKERELLRAKMELEDDIRKSLRKHVAEKYQFNLPPYISYEEKQQALTEVKEYVSQDISEERLLHDGLYRAFPIEKTTPNTIENREKLSEQEIEYEELPTGEFRYKGVARVREGYSLDNTPTNREFLEKNDIHYEVVKGSNLFVPKKAQKAALLLASSLLLSPMVGLALMYVLNKTRAMDKILVNKPFSPEEAKRLNRGETLRKETTENGRKVEKYYFIDNSTNHLRSIPVNELHLPNRVNGVSLSPKELDDLRIGKKVMGYDENSKMYYEAQLDLNNRSAIKMGFKELKATKEFSYIPKPNSPDQDKVKYVQLHGAQGVNDIWEKGGVNLERDSFLDKYDVEGFYKDYLSADQSKNPTKVAELSASIKDSLSRDKNLSISR